MSSLVGGAERNPEAVTVWLAGYTIRPSHASIEELLIGNPRGRSEVVAYS